MRELQIQRKRRVGILCDLLMDVCLGVGVWPHMQSYVRFTYLISLFCSLSLSFKGVYTISLQLLRDLREEEREEERESLL